MSLDTETTAAMPFTMNADYHSAYPPALAYAEHLKPKLAETLKRVLAGKNGQGHFTYCDYGTANCRGSSSVLAHFVVDELRRVDKDRQISIVFQDQPHNDFRAAFTEVQKALCEKDDETKLFLSSVGRSFFMQCLPRESLHLGVSVMSLHYLSSNAEGFDFPLLRRIRPCQTGHSVNAMSISDRSRLTELARIGAEHWESFLLHRAKELAVGGHLLLAVNKTANVPLSEWKEMEVDGVCRGLPDIWWTFTNAVHEMVDEDQLTEDEEKAFIVPKYYRTTEEIKAPFLDKVSPVNKSGLQLVDLWETFVKLSDGKGSPKEMSVEDARVMAKQCCNQMRSFTETLLSGCLEKTGKRSNEEIQSLVEDIFKRVERIMFEERWFPQQPAVAVVVIGKAPVD